MAGEQLILDPTSEDASNTQLDITSSTAGYWLLTHDYPTPEDDEVWASSADTEGARRANTRPNNRTITCTVRCREAAGTPVIGTIVGKLQQKIGKLNRDGGTYKRVLPSGDVIVFDVLAARVNKVPSDQAWATMKKADVDLQFTCKPRGRGAPVTLTTHTASDTKAPLIFTETAIKGDVPALGALLITNPGLIKKNYGIWGVQSRYYSNDTQNALLYQGEDGAAIGAGAAANPGASGASGASTNKVMRLSDVGMTGGTSLYYPSGGSSSTPNLLYHVGTFRVLARVQPLSTNTGITSVQVSASVGGVAGPVSTNDWVPIQDISNGVIKGAWVEVDLGLVTLPKARVSSGGPGGAWIPTVTAKSTTATDDIDIDWIALVPIDEGAGVVMDNGQGINGGDSFWINHERADIGESAIGWSRPNSYEGDYLLVPPSGLEARTARFIVILTGDFLSANDNLPSVVDATTLDAITATLTYTPRYLVVPEP